MNTKRDYYQILGIAKNADDTEIKKAFRTLARKYHPDISKEPGAEAKFKEVNAAYEVLSDPSKRRTYDQFGHAGLEGAGFSSENINPFDIFNEFFNQQGESFFGGEDPTLNTIFSQFFGGRQNTRRAPNKNEVQAAIEITFADSIKGCKYNFRYQYDLDCSDCKSTGALNGDKAYITVCSQCKGSGVLILKRQTLFGQINTRAECNKCHGKGKTITKVCKKCRGNGAIATTREIELSIPAGIEPNKILLFKHTIGAATVSLAIQVLILPSQVFQRNGMTIYTKVIVNPLIAIAGGEVEIPSPWGIKTIRIKAGTKDGEQLKVVGAGVRVENNKIKSSGDLIGIIEYAPPPTLNQEQIQIIQSLNTPPAKETELWIKRALKEID